MSDSKQIAIRHPKTGKQHKFKNQKFVDKYTIRDSDRYKLNLPSLQNNDEINANNKRVHSSLTDSYSMEQSEKIKKFKSLQGLDELEKMKKNPMLDKVAGNIMYVQNQGRYVPVMATRYKANAVPTARRKFIKPPRMPIRTNPFVMDTTENYKGWMQANNKGRQIAAEVGKRIDWRMDGKFPDNPYNAFGNVSTDAVFANYGRPHKRAKQDQSQMNRKQDMPLPKSFPISGPRTELRVAPGLRTNFLKEAKDQILPSIMESYNPNSAPATQRFMPPSDIAKYDEKWNKDRVDGISGTKTFGNFDQFERKNKVMNGGNQSFSNLDNLQSHFNNKFHSERIVNSSLDPRENPSVTTGKQNVKIPRISTNINRRSNPQKLGIGTTSNSVVRGGIAATALFKNQVMNKITPSEGTLRTNLFQNARMFIS